MAVTPNPAQQVKIDFIVSCLKLAESRAEILRKAEKKFQVSRGAFDRLLKIAKEQHTEAYTAVRTKLAAVDEQEEVKARKKAIMTSDERRQTLSKIANGTLRVKKIFIIGGKIVERMIEPDHGERRAAAAELNKMYGDYMPKKIATTDAAGNDIEQPLTPDMLKEILQAIK